VSIALQSQAGISRARRWALRALGVAIVAQIAWIVVILMAGRGSLSYMARPLLFGGTMTLLFATRGAVPWIVFMARLVIGGAFLNALWHRFDDFSRFVAYTSQVNAFLPAGMIPFLAVVATVLECVLCTAILLGIATRWAAIGSAVLLFLFATAMVASGLDQFEWAVYVLSTGAWVVATADTRFASIDGFVSRRARRGK
jgi:putative oxidoreductase